MAGQEEGRGWVRWGSGRVGVGGWDGVKWCGTGRGELGVFFRGFGRIGLGT